MTNAADVAKAEDERAIAAKEEAAKEEKADRETIERLKLRSTVAKICARRGETGARRGRRSWRRGVSSWIGAAERQSWERSVCWR